MKNIFQITENDVSLYALDDEDLGTWCFIEDGRVVGFAPTRDAADDMLLRGAPPAVIYIR